MADPALPADPDDLVDLSREEESLFARDYDGRLIRVDKPSLADLGKRVKVRIDGSAFFEVPKAVPATDAQGNILRNPDDTPVVRATTIFDAARSEAALAAGVVPPPGCPVRIPVLCHRDHLSPVAVCRVCAVQIVKPDPRKPDDPKAKRVERKLLPACQHRVEAGMEVHTMWSPEADYRKAVRGSVQVLWELLAGDHYHPAEDAALRDRGRKYHNELAGASPGEDALDRGPAADLQAVLRANWEAHRADAKTPREEADRDRVLACGSRFAPKPYRPDLVVGWADVGGRGRLATAPPFVVDHNNCVLCDRCIRACSEVKPFRVIGRTGKGATTRIAFDLADVPMAESSCRACGECMTACPTGAITFQYRVMDASPDRLADVLAGKGRAPKAEVVEADDLLAQPLFARLSKAFLEWNRGAVRRRAVRPGDVVAEEGEFGTTAFVLLPGDGGRDGVLLAVCRRGGKTPKDMPFAQVAEVHAALKAVPAKLGRPIWVHGPDPTDVLGEMSPMSHTRRNASLVAVRAGDVLEVDRNVLHQLLRDPVNRVEMDRRYAQRAVLEFLPKAVERSALFQALRDGDGDGADGGWVRKFTAHLTKSLAAPAGDMPSWFAAGIKAGGRSTSFGGDGSSYGGDGSSFGGDGSSWGGLSAVSAADVSRWTRGGAATATHLPIPTADRRGRGDGVELVRADPGQVICREGDPADNFYLIRNGFVEVSVAGPAGKVLPRPPFRQGDCFGEVAVLTRGWPDVDRAVGRPVRRGVRIATCTALDHVELVMVPAGVFDTFVNNPANEAVRDRLRRRCVELLSGAR